MSLRTYNMKDISFICGERAITGFAEGDAITVRRREDMYKLKIGASGEGVRSKTNNRSGQWEINLLQGSDDNEFFSALAVADELNGGGKFPVRHKDNGGSSLYGAEQVWATKIPDSAFAVEAGAVTWLLETHDMTMFIGKNEA